MERKSLVLKQDSSCHWYLIDAASSDNFDELDEKIENTDDNTDLCAEFDRKFGTQMINGPHDVIIHDYSFRN